MSTTSPVPSLPSRPFGLFLDVDGTIIDIAARPDGVTVPEPLHTTLALLSATLDGAVALVSGRSIADLDALFAPLRLRASGVHGAEMRTDPEGAVHVSPEHLLRPETVAAITAAAARHGGTLVENKRFSVAVHFRAAPEVGAALRADLEALLVSEPGSGLRILPGHMVFEIKRSGFDKGTAIATLQAQPPFAGRLPVFIGDDITDLPGFERVLALGGLAYSVLTPRPGLSGHFDDPSAVRAWLASIAAESGLEPGAVATSR